MAILEAVYVDHKEVKAVVAIQPSLLSGLSSRWLPQGRAQA